MKTKKILVSVLATVGTLGLLTACTTKKTASTPTSENASSAQQSSATPTNQSSAENTNSGSADIKVTLDEAIKAYQGTYPGSDITSLELDSSFGQYFYKIEGVDDSYEYQIRVDAVSKQIDKEKQEQLDRDEQNGVKRNEDKLDLTDLISIEKAAEIAEKAAGGGFATDWDLDKEIGTTYWEVKVQDGRKETQVKINAKTGDILETEVDD